MAAAHGFQRAARLWLQRQLLPSLECRRCARCLCWCAGWLLPGQYGRISPAPTVPWPLASCHRRAAGVGVLAGWRCLRHWQQQAVAKLARNRSTDVLSPGSSTRRGRLIRPLLLLPPGAACLPSAGARRRRCRGTPHCGRGRWYRRAGQTALQTCGEATNKCEAACILFLRFSWAADRIGAQHAACQASACISLLSPSGNCFALFTPHLQPLPLIPHPRSHDAAGLLEHPGQLCGGPQRRPRPPGPEPAGAHMSGMDGDSVKSAGRASPAAACLAPIATA